VYILQFNFQRNSLSSAVGFVHLEPNPVAVGGVYREYVNQSLRVQQ